MLDGSLYNIPISTCYVVFTAVQADSCSATDHHTVQRLLKYNHPPRESTATNINTDLRRGERPALGTT